MAEMVFARIWIGAKVLIAKPEAALVTQEFNEG